MEPIGDAHVRKEKLMLDVLEVFKGQGIHLERKEPDDEWFKPRYGALYYAKDKIEACTYVKCGPEDSDEEADFEENPYEITEGCVHFEYRLGYHELQGDVCDFHVWRKMPLKGLKEWFTCSYHFEGLVLLTLKRTLRFERRFKQGLLMKWLVHKRYGPPPKEMRAGGVVLPYDLVCLVWRKLS